MQETRQFKMHPHLLLDVMQKQAGSISKAILEGIMNSVDAGAKRCDVTLTDKTLAISDDGKGLRSKEEIVSWWEVFGQPHSAGEGKVYGSFRMGRGQMFSFGKNTWKSSGFVMDVDIKARGLDYGLTCNASHVAGCEIAVDLYNHLLPSDLYGTIRDVEKMAKYVPLTLRLNGKVVSIDPSKEKWDHVTDEAYVRLKDSTSLAVYNLGVWVKDFGNYQFGCGGTVVSRKQLALNFARNDILLADCAVWRKVRKLVDQKATEKNKRKPTLDDGERQRLAEQVAAGEIEPNEAARLKLFTDVSGRHLSAQQLANCQSGGKVTSAPKGDRLGDKLLQSGAFFVMADETIERFGCDGLKGLVKVVQARCGLGYWTPKVVPFGDATRGMDSRHVILDPKQWAPREKAWVAMFEASQRHLLYGFVKGEEVEWSHVGDMRRKVLVGESDSALAWTDGSSYVALSRNFLRYIQFSMKGVMELFEVGLHEYCHDDSDAGTHVHSPDFYQRFHDCIAGVREAAQAAFVDMPGLLERHGQRLGTLLLKQKDAEAKAVAALNRHKAFVGEPSKADAIPLPPIPVKAEQPVAARAIKVTAVQSVGGNPYKASSSYGILYGLGTQKDWLRDDLLAEASALTGKSVEALAMSLRVLMNPNHKSNGGKSRAVRDGDKVRLERAAEVKAA